MTIKAKWAKDQGGPIEERQIEITQKKTVQNTQTVTLKGLKARIANFDREIEQARQRKAEVLDQIREIEAALGIEDKEKEAS